MRDRARGTRLQCRIGPACRTGGRSSAAPLRNNRNESAFLRRGTACCARRKTLALCRHLAARNVCRFARDRAWGTRMQCRTGRSSAAPLQNHRRPVKPVPRSLYLCESAVTRGAGGTSACFPSSWPVTMALRIWLKRSVSVFGVCGIRIVLV